MKLHHTGILTDNIEKSAEVFCKTCGYKLASEKIHDEVQTAYVQFLQLEEGMPYLELVCPDGENSKLSKALKAGVKFHHICYQVDDIKEALKKFRDENFFVIAEPTPAKAFEGRKIAWVMDANKLLIEFVEAKKGAKLNLD